MFMNRYIKIFLIGIVIVLLIVIFSFLYNDYRVKHAKIEVETIDNLNVEVYSNVYLKDLIKNINGRIINNKKINTTKLGKQKIKFKYVNDDNIKVKYSFNINVVDTTPPVISDTNSINVMKGYNGNLEDRIFCADNYDNNPECIIEGNYDLNTLGSYSTIFKATDSSNNKSSHELTINVIEPNNSDNNSLETVTNYSDIYSKFKNDNTKIGIDVSHHQKDIDFNKLKDSNVEFVFIRVGYGYNKDGKNVLDEKFKNNIEGFNKVKIPVGIYFFSYAENIKEAKNQAKWVIKQVKDYKIDLPIVFDWENWGDFKNYNLSLHDLNNIASSFISEVEREGYKGMLYSSKNYLKYAWYGNDYDVWIAHYNENSSYENVYKMWQICDDGKIDGVDTKIDIDIMYQSRSEK